MNKIILFVVLFLPLFGCGKTDKNDDDSDTYKPSENYAIYVTGDEGIEFTGAVGTDGAAESVSGTTPKEFSFESGSIISGSFQKKKDNEKTIRAECYIYKTKMKEAKTKEAYGVVAVACGY